MSDFRNPFSNARIIGTNIDYPTYSRQTAQRGDMDFIMSSGQLKTFATCPKKWRAGWEPGDSEAKDYGNLIDCLVLRPDQFDSLFAVRPDTYPDAKTGEPKKWNNNATFCKEWNAEQERTGREPIASAALLDAETAAATLRDNQTVMQILDCSQKQVMVVAEYNDRETGIVVPVRVLLDIVPYLSGDFGHVIADLKSTRSAHPFAFSRQVFQFGYDLQAALYMDIYEAASGEQRTDWAFVAQESEFPWIVADPVPILSAEQLEMGRMKYSFALQQYAQCLSANRWPGYPPTRNIYKGFQILEPEDWMVGRLSAMTIQRTFEEPSTPRTEEEPVDLIP